ncbi:MAG: radical SAM protein [Deltaproteobacteria bacterium]|nr:radical SAM protein [Deltaproteobacteria bacterium]
MKKTVSFSRNSANLFLHITTRCNLTCRHCYINPRQHGDKTLSLATVESWLDLFARRSVKTNIIFLGGEPTLHPDLARMIKTARKLAYDSITVDTNGFLFHDILSKVTPRDVDYFSFSLDGATASTNDRIRGAGSFAACTNGIRQAVACGFSASAIFTVSRTNIHEIGLMGPLLSTLGVKRFFIQVIGIRGRSAANRAENLQVVRDEWLGTVPAAAEKIMRLGITVTFPKVFLEAGERFECAGRVADNYFVFPNGRVYRCPLCEDFPLHSLMIDDNCLTEREPINENDLFRLDIPEGCVMNKLIQPDNLSYRPDGTPEYRVACCLLKEEFSGL